MNDPMDEFYDVWLTEFLQKNGALPPEGFKVMFPKLSSDLYETFKAGWLACEEFHDEFEDGEVIGMAIIPLDPPKEIN